MCFKKKYAGAAHKEQESAFSCGPEAARLNTRPPLDVPVAVEILSPPPAIYGRAPAPAPKPVAKDVPPHKHAPVTPQTPPQPKTPERPVPKPAPEHKASPKAIPNPPAPVARPPPPDAAPDAAHNPMQALQHPSAEADSGSLPLAPQADNLLAGRPSAGRLAALANHSAYNYDTKTNQPLQSVREHSELSYSDSMASSNIMAPSQTDLGARPQPTRTEPAPVEPAAPRHIYTSPSPYAPAADTVSMTAILQGETEHIQAPVRPAMHDSAPTQQQPLQPQPLPPGAVVKGRDDFLDSLNRNTDGGASLFESKSSVPWDFDTRSVSTAAPNPAAADASSAIMSDAGSEWTLSGTAQTGASGLVKPPAGPLPVNGIPRSGLSTQTTSRTAFSRALNTDRTDAWSLSDPTDTVGGGIKAAPGGQHVYVPGVPRSMVSGVDGETALFSEAGHTDWNLSVKDGATDWALSVKDMTPSEWNMSAKGGEGGEGAAMAAVSQPVTEPVTEPEVPLRVRAGADFEHTGLREKYRERSLREQYEAPEDAESGPEVPLRTGADFGEEGLGEQDQKPSLREQYAAPAEPGTPVVAAARVSDWVGGITETSSSELQRRIATQQRLSSQRAQ